MTDNVLYHSLPGLESPRQFLGGVRDARLQEAARAGDAVCHRYEGSHQMRRSAIKAPLKAALR